MTPVRRSWVPHVLATLWFVAVGLVLLLPTLVHGSSLGEFDVLSKYGLTKHAGIVVHDPLNADQIDEMIPWAKLAWTQVHHGQIPLWNPYNTLGMPLAFNWQSAPFSLPALVGYLFPLHLMFSAQVITTLITAGSGAYVFCRLLGLGFLACIFGGTVFELCGALTSWLGWPIAGVVSWTGWSFAALILILSQRRRVWAVALFALCASRRALCRSTPRPGPLGLALGNILRRHLGCSDAGP